MLNDLGALFSSPFFLATFIPLIVVMLLAVFVRFKWPFYIIGICLFVASSVAVTLFGGNYYLMAFHVVFAAILFSLPMLKKGKQQ